MKVQITIDDGNEPARATSEVTKKDVGAAYGQGRRTPACGPQPATTADGGPAPVRLLEQAAAGRKPGHAGSPRPDGARPSPGTDNRMNTGIDTGPPWLH